MARKNIFQIIESKRDITQEVLRLNSLLNNEKGISIYKETSSVLPPQFYKSSRVEDFVDSYIFKLWKCRGTCVSLEDMAETLGIEDMFTDEDYSEENILIYVEYVANVLFLATKVRLAEKYSYYLNDSYVATRENLDNLLGWMNYERRVFEKKEQVLIVRKSAATTAVAEIVEENLSYQIVKYNHHSLKGDIESKKAILLALGSELEPKRKDISEINKRLADDIFFMLNNLNLRHNNRSKSDKNYKEAVAKMRKTALEDWYDELYQMLLLAFLELDNKERSERVSELKTKING